MVLVCLPFVVDRLVSGMFDSAPLKGLRQLHNVTVDAQDGVGLPKASFRGTAPLQQLHLLSRS